MVTQAGKRGVPWLYLCGVGDPPDRDYFAELIELAIDNHARMTLFTNGLGLTKDIALMLKKSGSCVLLKLDSFDSGRFDALLGRKAIAE